MEAMVCSIYKSKETGEKLRLIPRRKATIHDGHMRTDFNFSSIPQSSLETISDYFRSKSQQTQGVKITKSNSEYFVPFFSSNFKIKEGFTKKS